MKKSNLKILASIIIFFIIGLIFYFTVIDKVGTFSTTNYYLDTVNQISVINTRKSKANKVLPASDKIVLDIHNKMSSQLASSEVSKINQNAGIQPIKVSDDTYTVIKKAISYSQKTGGKFDISVGAISSIWNIGNESARVPSSEEIKSLLPLVNYKDISLNDKEKSVYLKKKGMKIDLGGIAKGYCADKLADYLKENGVKNAIINLGGNIYVFGQNAKKTDFNVGVQDPAKTNTEPLGTIQLTDMSIVTSGVYERFIEKDGKVYHHMINPTTGYPFENNLSSVTIISKKSIDGDALSTSTFGLGLEEGMKFIEGLEDVDAIFITNDKKIFTSKGIKDKFKLENSSYSLAN